MRRLLTTSSRWAAATCLLLGVLLVDRAVEAPSSVYAVLAWVLAVTAWLTAAKMWLHNCFESHLAAGLVIAATVGSTLLALTVGIPGESRSDLTAVRGGELVLVVLLIGLLVVDARVRREHARRARRTYAR